MWRSQCVTVDALLPSGKSMQKFSLAYYWHTTSVFSENSIPLEFKLCYSQLSIYTVTNDKYSPSGIIRTPLFLLNSFSGIIKYQ